MPRLTLALVVVLSFVAPAAGQDDPLARNAALQRLLQSYVTLETAPFRGSEEEMQAWRERVRPELDNLISSGEAFVASGPAAPDALLLLSLAHARRANLMLDRRRTLDQQAAAIDAEQPNPDLLTERAIASREVSREYRAIFERLGEALASADELAARRELGLVRGVVLAQSAIVENAAINASEEAGEEMVFDALEMRALLDDAEALLQTYLEQTPREHGLEWVRGRFYLGVVQYRRSLKNRVPGTEYFTEYDPERAEVFDDATRIFQELADPDWVLSILRPHSSEDVQQTSPAGIAYESSSFRLRSNYSYEAVASYYAAAANLYLGMLSAIGPEPEEGRLAVVGQYMGRARELDLSAPQPGEEPISLTAETIPLSYDRVMTELENVSEAPAEGQPLHDLTLTFGTGYLYDTNVTLLGDRTALPQDIPSEADSRFPNTFRMSYILDGGAVAPDSEELSKWQLFAEARVTSTWNTDVTSFNEQIYGGTINLRRELIGPDVAENLDGLLAHIRYDFDHIVLGNDGFLGINRVRPMLQMLAWERRIDASLFFSWEGRDYSELLTDPRFNRDGDYITIGADVRFDLGDWVEGELLWGADSTWGGYGPREDDPEYRRPMEVGIGYERTINATAGDEFDYSSHIISTGLRFPFPMGIDFRFSGVWEWQEYWRHSLIDRQRRFRNDFIQEYVFALERKFFLTDYEPDFAYIEPLRLDRVVLTLRGEVRFIDNDSNVVDRLGQTPFEYDRALYGLGLRLELN